MCRKALPLLKHLSWRRQGTLSAPEAHCANSSGITDFFFISFISVNSQSETNPGSLLKPDLPLVSAEFCQRRSAAPSAAQAAGCIHEEQHKGIYTTETPFCQLISILDHCCTIQTHQQSGWRKHSSAARGRAVIFTHLNTLKNASFYSSSLWFWSCWSMVLLVRENTGFAVWGEEWVRAAVHFSISILYLHFTSWVQLKSCLCWALQTWLFYIIRHSLKSLFRSPPTVPPARKCNRDWELWATQEHTVSDFI